MNKEERRRAIKKGWRAIVEVMKTGGFYDKVINGDASLDRVKEFIGILEGSRPDPLTEMEPSLDRPHPWLMPLFPGLRNVKFPKPDDFAWVPRLEAAFEDLREEGLMMHGIYRESAYGDSTQKGGKWLQGHLSIFGSRLPAPYFGEQEPKNAMELVTALPGFCGFSGFPYGEAYYSAMDPGLHIPPHTSSDNLRVRCHLALAVAGDCGIKVGGETRTWEEGKVLILDDSYVHEAWNRGPEKRLVLLIDFWHPDLTPVEIEALSMGLRKAEVRRLLAPTRNIPKEPLDQFFFPLFQYEESQDSRMATFWPNPTG